MQREQRVGVVRKEPTVLEVVAGIFSGLGDGNLMPLERGGEPIDSGEAEAERNRKRGT